MGSVDEVVCHVANTLLTTLFCGFAWNGNARPQFDMADFKLYQRELDSVYGWRTEFPFDDRREPRFDPILAYRSVQLTDRFRRFHIKKYYGSAEALKQRRAP